MSARLSCDIAVVGAGPAGLAAACAAAGAGASVICLDQFPDPGGQYAMQPSQPGSPFARTAAVRGGQEAAEAARAAGAELLTGAELFWAAALPQGGFCLSVQKDGAALSITAGRVIAALGAMERPLPFPGWTLPGVIGAGAAQRLLKTGSGRIPGAGKMVIAGSGPFLLAVAQSCAVAGQPVSDLVEMRRPGLFARLFRAHPERLPEALRLWRDLCRTGAARHMGHVVTRALGGAQLEAVEIAPLDASGRPDMARQRRIDGVSTLAVGFGFQPVVDMTLALGARHAFAPELGGWHCVTDADGAATVPGLYAAGETTGLGGALPARLSGRIAGLSAAGLPVSEAERRALRKASDFAARLAGLYPPPVAPPVALPGDEILCRCEDVRFADVQAAIAEGAGDALSVKLWTRAGMGPCQGRICAAGLQFALASAGVGLQDGGINRPHLPLRPTPVAVVRAAMAAQEELAGEGHT